MRKLQVRVAKHPRLHSRLTPTNCSWLHLLGRWFAELTNERIRRGARVTAVFVAA